MPRVNEPDDSYARLLSRARSDAARGLVRDITSKVTAWEQRARSRTKNRGLDAERALSETIERLVGDLLAAKCNTESTGRVWRPLATTAFTGEVVGYRDFRV